MCCLRWRNGLMWWRRGCCGVWRERCLLVMVMVVMMMMMMVMVVVVMMITAMQLLRITIVTAMT